MDLIGIGTGSDPFRPPAEREGLPGLGVFGTLPILLLLMREDLRPLVATELEPGSRDMLEFSEVFALAEGEVVRLELMLETEDEEEEVFLLPPTTCLLGTRPTLPTEERLMPTLLGAGRPRLPGKLVLREESLRSEVTLAVSESKLSEDAALEGFLLLGLRLSPTLPLCPVAVLTWLGNGSLSAGPVLVLEAVRVPPGAVGLLGSTVAVPNGLAQPLSAGLGCPLARPTGFKAFPGPTAPP